MFLGTSPWTAPRRIRPDACFRRPDRQSYSPFSSYAALTALGILGVWGCGQWRCRAGTTRSCGCSSSRAGHPRRRRREAADPLRRQGGRRDKPGFGMRAVRFMSARERVLGPAPLLGQHPGNANRQPAPPEVLVSTCEETRCAIPRDLAARAAVDHVDRGLAQAAMHAAFRSPYGLPTLRRADPQPGHARDDLEREVAVPAVVLYGLLQYASADESVALSRSRSRSGSGYLGTMGKRSGEQGGTDRLRARWAPVTMRFLRAAYPSPPFIGIPSIRLPPSA